MPATREEILQGVRRAAAKGRVPTGRRQKVTDEAIRAVMRFNHLSTLEQALRVGLSKSRYCARRRRIEDADELAKGKR